MSTAEPYGIDLLAFAPHPDDAEIFCGGILITLADLGYRTGVVDLTRGELASQGTVAERSREAEAASAVLGLTTRDNLALPDGAINGSPGSPQLPTVVDALRRARPELVLFPWTEERHPDHAAAAALVARSLFLAGLQRYSGGAGLPPFAPRQALHYELRHRMTASFIVDTSNAWDRKARAIACHVSQVIRRDAGANTLISSPLAIEAIEARDRYRGSEIGMRHGEALRCTQRLGIIDPVAHFRANPLPRAHAFESPR